MQKHIKKPMGLLLALVLIISCFSGASVVFADDQIAINEAVFPDANWRQVVSTCYDADGDGYLSAAERAVTLMSIPGDRDTTFEDDAENHPIVDLKGIEHFSSLKTLRCGGIGLVSLDVSGLTGLTTLTCQGNDLRELTVRSNTYLRELNCSDNQLTALSLSYNVNLQRLLCEENMIEALDTSALQELLYLKCSNNAVGALDLSKNTKLATLICSGNHLAELDLTANTALSNVTAYAIGLQTLTVQAAHDGNTFIVPLALDGARLVSTNAERYENGGFATETYSVVRDGLTYAYDTGYSGSEPMDVTVQCEKDFYLVEFYADAEHTVLLAANAADAGAAAPAPVVTELPQCKAFASWDTDISAVASDLQVHALYKDAHTGYVPTALRKDTGDVDLTCGGCGDVRTLHFIDHMNAMQGDASFVPELDANGDGCINLKDYVSIERALQPAAEAQ